MSIHVTTMVWQSARYSGSDLLVLLALADNANEQGVAWPSIAGLAVKARISERQVKRILARLERDLVIRVERGVGRSHTSVYGINLTLLQTSAKGDIQGQNSDIAVSPIELMEKVTSWTGKGDRSSEKVTSRVGKGDIAVSPEPYEPSREPSVEPLGIAGSVEPDPDPDDVPDADPVPTPRRRTQTTYPAAFETFWSEYPPGHGSKKAAFAVWETLAVDDELLAAILAGVAAWRQTRRWRDGFIRDAERFLKHRMWENPEPPLSPNGSPNGVVDQSLIDRLKAEARELSERRPDPSHPGRRRA